MTDDTVEAEVVPEGPWRSMTEAAAAVGVSKSTLRKWVRLGKLPHQEVPGPSGMAYAVPMDIVNELVARMPAPPTLGAATPSDAHLPVVSTDVAQQLMETFAALGNVRERAGLAEGRAAALEAEVGYLRNQAEGEAARAREEAEKRQEAEQRAALAEMDAERLRAEVKALALPAVVEPAAKRRWWRKAQ